MVFWFVAVPSWLATGKHGYDDKPDDISEGLTFPNWSLKWRLQLHHESLTTLQYWWVRRLKDGRFGNANPSTVSSWMSTMLFQMLFWFVVDPPQCKLENDRPANADDISEGLTFPYSCSKRRSQLHYWKSIALRYWLGGQLKDGQLGNAKPSTNFFIDVFSLIQCSRGSL